MDQDLIDRFLSAYNSTNRLIRDRVGADKAKSFTACLAMSRRDRLVARFETDLREFADLRNAIVHSATRHPIATPHLSVVESFERILELLSRPPTLLSIGTAPGAPQEVTVCRPSDTIGRISSDMGRRLLSQLPVLAEEGIVGVLTTGTIARWLGAEFSSNSQDAEIVIGNVTVSEALRHAEDPDNFIVVDPRTSVVQCLDAFEGRMQQGRTLDAVLVTQDGTASKAPQRIFTSFDLPRLVQAVAI